MEAASPRRTLERGSGVPRLVMQTWKTADVPEKWRPSPASVRRLMPHWRYVLLTDADNDAFVAAHFPAQLDWFRGLRYPIQRADVIRYMWLYVHGGLYMDLDIELVAPLDELFEGRAMETWLLKAPRNLAGHYTNFLMASTPRNPFWLAVLRECLAPLEAWVVLPHHIISQQTGLAALTRAATRWTRPLALLPQTALVPCDYCNPDACAKPFSYTRFLQGQSWNGPDTFLLNILSCKPEVVALALIGALVAWWVWRRRQSSA